MTPRYSRPFYALLIIVFCFINGLPALAAHGQGNPSHGTVMGFDQIIITAPWKDRLPLPQREFGYSAASSTGADLSATGYDWEGPPDESPDRRGLKRDTLYFVTLQFAVVAVLYVAPESLSGWSEEDKEEYSFNKWKENVTNPIWDDDKWWVNYILHPYWGATYYTRGQERGLTNLQAMGYSFLLSTLYEFGAEALFEPVSIQDLIVTPIGGALLGEYVFNPIRRWVRAKDQLNLADKTILFITDPIGVISDELSRVLGINTQVSFKQLNIKNITPTFGEWDDTETRSPARYPIKPIWGLNVRISW